MDLGLIYDYKELLLPPSVHYFVAPYDTLKIVYGILYAGISSPVLQIEKRCCIKNKRQTTGLTKVSPTLFTVIP